MMINGTYYDGSSVFMVFTLIFFIFAAIFSVVAQSRINSVFKKFSNVGNSQHITGAQAARAILDSKGLQNVQINMHNGNALQNFYNPADNTVNLSAQVYNSSSITAVGVAAHECGHAIQHAESYMPVKVRASLVPAANFSSRMSTYIIIAGLIFSRISFISYYIAIIGVVLFAITTIFYLVTYPVETNASNRAMKQLESTIALPQEDMKGVKKVLRAAANTYLAALLSALASLLRFVAMMVGRRRR